MILSNKKRKFIQRNAATMPPVRMARELKIPVKEVEKALREMAVGAGAVRTEEMDRVSAMVLFYLTAAFLLLAPLAVKPGIYDFANLPQSAFIQTGALFLAGLVCARKAYFSESKIFWPPFALPLLAFIAWSGISIFWAVNQYEGFTTWSQWAACGLVFLVVANVLSDEKDALTLLVVVFISGLATALLGIGQHLLPLAVDFVPQVIAPAATFANKNMAVHHVVLTLPLGAGFFLAEKKPWRAWFFALASGLMAVFLIYSLTRGGWAASFLEAVTGGVLLLLVRRWGGTWAWNRQKALALAIAVVVFFCMINLTPRGFSWEMGRVLGRATTAARQFAKAVLPVSPAPAPEALPSAEDEAVPAPLALAKPAAPSTPDVSVELRLDIWRNTWEMIKEYPVLGVGLGNHKIQYPLYVRRAVVEKVFSEEAQLTNVHNDFLQTFAETGLVGVALLAWLALSLFRAVFAMLAGKDRGNRLPVLAVAVCMVGIGANSMVSFPFQRAIPPLALAACLASLARIYTPPEKRERAFPRLLAGFLALGFFAFFLVAASTYSQWIKADAHYLRVTSAEKAEMWNLVLNEASTAYHFNPHRQKIQSYVGRAYIETGRYEEGIEALKKVLAAYPNHMNALLNMGVAYGSDGQYEEALEAYDQVLAIKPDYSKVHNNRGNVFIKQGRYAEALEAFETAAGLDPGNPIVHFNAGIAALRVQDWAKAEKGFSMALEVSRERPGVLPEDPEVLHYNLGAALMAQKKYEEAAGEFRKALELRPQWPEAHRNLGSILMQLPDGKQEGMRHLQEAFRMKPELFPPSQASPQPAVSAPAPAPVTPAATP
ncbi:MAG: tetratricopeptide repeat protein [Proteobacteria bacterium]|nr:tetratricopeptide repeat protein [Pseudomonadota bacterium]